MFLHDVKIGTKLFLAFGFFIVLMGISASLSLLSLNRANNGMQSIITSDYPTTVKANQLIENFQEFISTQQLMLLDDQGTYTAQSEQHLKAISERITLILGELDKASRISNPSRCWPISAAFASSILTPAIAFCRRCRTTIGRGRFRR